MHPASNDLNFIKHELGDMLCDQNLPDFLTSENVGILEQFAWLLFDRARLLDELGLHKYTLRSNRNAIASDLANLYEEELKTLRDSNRQSQLNWDEKRQTLSETIAEHENDYVLLKQENEELRARLASANIRRQSRELLDKKSKTDEVVSSASQNEPSNKNKDGSSVSEKNLEIDLLRQELNSLHLRYIRKRDRHKSRMQQARDYYESECKKLECSVTTYHKQYLEEKTRANAMEKKLKQANIYNWEVKAKITESERELSNKDKRIQLLENRCLALESQMNNLMKELDNIGDERNRLSSELRSYTMIVTDCKKNLEDQNLKEIYPVSDIL